MTEPTARTGARRKRSDQIADEIKLWIMRERVRPGERMPRERELMRAFGASKGTIREALKSLEVQGLVRVKTGPQGGAAVSRVSEAKATELLSNYFYSEDISLRDIYEARKVLEPQLAQSVIGRLDDRHLESLARSINLCSCEPLGAPGNRLQRIAELDFHDVLAEACPNPLLSYVCRFLNSLLKNLAVCQRIYDEPRRELTDRGRHYHERLVEAFRAGDAGAAAEVMREHMAEAERLMLAHEAIVERRFLLHDDLLDGGGPAASQGPAGRGGRRARAR